MYVPDVPVVCLVRKARATYSETFVRAHVQRLPARIHVLGGGHVPWRTPDGRELLSQTPVCRLIRAALRRGLRLPPDYFEKAALVRFLRQHKVDAVLVEFAHLGVRFMEVCRATGIPLIVCFRGWDAYREICRPLFQEAAALLVEGQHQKRYLLACGTPQERVHYNPSGADTVLFTGGDPAQAPPLFLAAGRFVDKKAPQLTLLAFKKVKECFPQARLVMIGDGPLWESCKQLARGLRVADSVEFRAPCSHEELAAAMRGVRAFVQHSVVTSHGNLEGTPVAVLEAGATGLPVVATRHPGIDEAVIDEQTGFLVEERDTEGMAERMLRLAREPALARRLGQAAQERVRAEFSQERHLTRVMEVIHQTIRERRKT